MTDDIRTKHAFPSGDGRFGGGPGHDYGMTLRDWFASQSLLAISRLWKGNLGDFDNEAADRTAKAAYRMADAMLAQRSPQGIASE